jgi:hypothetical protein
MDVCNAAASGLKLACPARHRHAATGTLSTPRTAAAHSPSGVGAGSARHASRSRSQPGLD